MHDVALQRLFLKMALKLGMYKISAALHNPATFCQIWQFLESDNENWAKNARKHDKKMWPKYELQSVICQKFSP